MKKIIGGYSGDHRGLPSHGKQEAAKESITDGRYWPEYVQMFADIAKQRSHNPHKLDADMRAFIRQKIERRQWLPEQINGYCNTNGIPMARWSGYTT